MGDVDDAEDPADVEGAADVDDAEDPADVEGPLMMPTMPHM